MAAGHDRISEGPETWGPKGTVGATFAARMSFENVSLSFAGIDAVREVSFELPPGDVVCLLGPSGCGKTTLLRIAAGIEKPQSGRVLLGGEVVAGPGVFVPPEQRGVGLMFQDFALFPHMTNLENVAYGLKFLDRRAALIEARNALRRVGLSEYADTYPWALSGGEQQRVALARAIVPRPRVILMDEPFSGLDQRLREGVRRGTLELLKETRSGALIVTHDPLEAMELADRILLMRQGRLVQQGTPRELYQLPIDADAARFFSHFNEIEAPVVRGRITTPFGRLLAKGIPEGTAAVVMIRPQGLLPLRAGQQGAAARILDVRFLGDEMQLTVLFETMEKPFLARVPAAAGISAGETVRFIADPSHIFMFAT
jgi:iron(III) transport system ATP-binding protein